MSPLLVATVGAILLRSKVAFGAWVLCAAVQTVAAMLDLRLLRGRSLAWYWVPLEIVRTYLIAWCWLCACVSRRIDWRGHPFLILKGTRLVPARPSLRPRARALAQRLLFR